MLSEKYPTVFKTNNKGNTMAMLRYGNAALSTPIVAPDKWVDKKVPAGRVKIARSMIARYDPSLWLLSHVTIIASVDTEFADKNDPKSNYLIIPEHSQFVNNNGDCWERNLLKATYKSFLNADNFCFAAGTRVLMSDGTYKAIETISEGDRVIDRTGNVGVVKKTFVHETDELVEVQSRGILSRSLFVTPNHPFWVYSARPTCPKTGRPNNFEASRDFCLLGDWKGFAVGVHRHKGEEFPTGLEADWKNSGDLDKSRDFLTHPVSNIEIEQDDINNNRAELIGWFLAEGYYMQTNHSSEDESGVAFSLGLDEIDIGNRLISLLKEEFGHLFRVDCKPRGYELQNSSYVIYVSNKTVADFFKRWCGKYAWSKKLAEEAMWLPKHQQALILKHCLNGDGCGKVESRGYSLELKSRDLIQQLLWLSWRLELSPVYRETGVLPRYSECTLVDGFEVFVDPKTGKKSRPGYLLRYSTRDSKKINDKLCVNDEMMSKRASKRITHVFSHEDKDYILEKIDKVDPKEIKCKVYNIEVEGDNSYIAEGVVVHNCEHVQIPELSKGKVIDVALREVSVGKDAYGKDLTTLYVDILIATNRAHSLLIHQITSGEYNSVSMGCLIAYSQCSKCGNIAADEPELCQDIRYYKHNYFHDRNGIKRIIAELCGRAEDPDSCKFVDASWVRKPAFGGAVLRNIIEPGEDVSEKIRAAILVPSFEAKPGMLLRAASEAASTLVREIKAQEGEETPEPPKDDTDFPSTGDEKELALDQPAEDTGTEPESMGLGGESPEEKAPEEEPQVQEPEDDASVKEVEDMMTKHILNKIRRKLLKEEVKQRAKQEDRPLESELDERESLVREANYKKLITAASQIKNHRLVNGYMLMSNLKDWESIKKYGYTRKDALALLSFFDSTLSDTPVSEEISRALSVIKTAGKTPEDIFTELIVETGVKPTPVIGRKILKWASILSKFE